MFEQTTPQSNFCLESLQVFCLGLDRLSGRMEQKCVGLPKKWDNFCHFVKYRTDVFEKKPKKTFQGPHETFGDHRTSSKTAAASPNCISTLTIFSSEVRCAGVVCERAHQPACFHYARHKRSVPEKQLKPLQAVIWPACGADIGTHLHSKSSHLRCASLPTVLFSVVCLSLCLFVRCCI